jgi:hypothetical protein
MEAFIQSMMAKIKEQFASEHRRNPMSVSNSTFSFSGKSKTFKKNLRKQIKLNNKRR